MDREIELEELSELGNLLSDNDDCDLFRQEETGSCTMELVYDDCNECRAARVQKAGFRKSENVRKEVIKELHDRLRKALEKRSKTAKERGEKYITIEILDAELSIDEIAYENGVEVDE